MFWLQTLAMLIFLFPAVRDHLPPVFPRDITIPIMCAESPDLCSGRHQRQGVVFTLKTIACLFSNCATVLRLFLFRLQTRSVHDIRTTTRGTQL